MHRTELCFRKLHERVLLLEQRQAVQGPTDEQVERALRKILDERFSDLGTHTRKLDAAQDPSWFVKDPRDIPYPRSIKMDIASLIIPPDAVPSKAYSETFRMLESGLRGFPGDYMLDSDDEEDCKMNVGGWVPPDIVRNQVADLSSYLDQLRSAQIGNFVIEVFDAQNVSLGTIVADREDLGSSPLLQRLMNGNGRTQVQLHCCATTVVQSYVRCTSSKGLVELPAHLLRDSSLLMNLYCLSTQLEDDSIRELILALWHRFAESNTEVSLGLEDLNLLFECTCSGDPAREFWTTTVCTIGLAAQLIKMGECNVNLIAEIQDVVARASV